MLHASTVAIGGRAILICGPSGSGKSDLALRLIDRGAILVSDDYTLVKRTESGLSAFAAPNITGKMEVRGIGIVDMPYSEGKPVALIVALSEAVVRMPGAEVVRQIAGTDIPAVTLNALEASAPIKVEIALKAALA